MKGTLGATISSPAFGERSSAMASRIRLPVAVHFNEVACVPNLPSNHTVKLFAERNLVQTSEKTNPGYEVLGSSVPVLLVAFAPADTLVVKRQPRSRSRRCSGNQWSPSRAGLAQGHYLTTRQGTHTQSLAQRKRENRKAQKERKEENAFSTHPSLYLVFRTRCNRGRPTCMGTS